MAAQEILTERNVVIEVLQKYRRLQYLWNPTHKLYTNKIARNQGMEILLKSWRKLDPEANLECIKKKLNNWRAAYRRERKKVEDSKAAASEPDEIHKPYLWYYDYLKFLHDDCPVLSQDDHDYGGNESDITSDNDIGWGIDTTIEEQAASNNDDDNDSETEEEPEQKPRKSYKRKFTERLSKQEQTVDTSQVLVHLHDETSADWFGRSIGCQLKEVSKFQRVLAEKLISEIMFHAKLEQLTIGSSISLEPSSS